MTHPDSSAAEAYVLPLSYAQERLWFLDQYEPGSALYNVPVAIRLDGHLDLPLLERALNEIVARHEVLRTTFETVDGVPMQCVAPGLAVAPTFDDFSAYPLEEARRRAWELSQEEARIPFRLDRGPLIRVRVMRLAALNHILVLTLHHIVSDGWSIGVLVKEFSALYAAFVQGRPSPLPDLDIQYGDYAAWQREQLAGPVLQQQLAYWRARLAGAPPLLTLPTDRPRPAQQSYAGADHYFDIPPPAAAAVRALCKRLHVTLFTALTATLGILLARHAGQQDLCIGTVTANRDRPETAALIGMFLNTLVLRLDVDGALTFEALLQQVRTTALDAFAHQDVPFEQLSSALSMERQTSYSPFFQVMLVLQNAVNERLDLPGIDGEMQDAQRGTSLYDLSLNVIERGERMFAYFEYSTALFDAARIARMAEHFVQLLGAACADPGRRVDGLEMLAPDERRALLLDWAQHPVEHPASTVHEMFARQAARTPAARAVIDGDAALTYAELDRRANGLAHALRAQGVGRGTVVGICAHRGAALVVGLLAILKAGAAYLPLDPSYPAERLAWMLADAAPALVLAQAETAERLPAHGAPTRLLDAPVDGSVAATAPAAGAGPHDPAYVIYSSGSTGQPKGVIVPHRQVVNRFHWFWDRYPFDAATVGCHKTSINFVDSLWEIFGYLLGGAPTVLVPEEAMYDHDQLLDLLARHRVTHFWLVPSLLKALLTRYPDLETRLPDLRFWSPGGEALSADLLAHFRQVLPRATLLNLYGLSEAWDAAFAEYAPGSAETDALIGQPLDNVELYVLDGAGNPLPVGVPGELVVGGAGLAQAYLNRPGLTAERFVPHPFAAVPGQRLYRTGDIASRRADGQLVYHGRADVQVKIRGFRIEPAEVEAALMALQGVRAAVVVAREDDAGERALVAYVAGVVTAADLRQQLRAVLPEFMVPAQVVVMEALPLTPNGKVDRLALPVPAAVRATDYVAPRNELEEAVAAIWAQVLKVEQVGVHDDFFALGGHSLLAMQLIAHLRDQFQVQLQPRLLFDQPTVATTAAVVEALIMAEIDKLSDEEALALANAQQP